MSTSPLFPDNRLAEIHALLIEAYGQPAPRTPWDPLTQFIYSLLSSRTKTVVSHQVLRDLQQHFGTWEALRDAPVEEIAHIIRAATFADKKAPQLKSALEEITRRYGSLTLDFLAGYSTEKIRTWLEQFPGVGPKTSAAVANFSTLRRRALAIDSHHQRIVVRLELVPRSATIHEIEARLMAIAPADCGRRHTRRPSLSHQAPWPAPLPAARSPLPPLPPPFHLPHRPEPHPTPLASSLFHPLYSSGYVITPVTEPQ